MDSLIGNWLGRYHILEKIGDGGMGTIYKAEDTMFSRTVAVKVILGQFRNSPKFFERFRREALSLARLEHTNIVKLLDFGEQEETAYLVMPYLTGGTLADRMNGPIPYPIAAEILAPVAQALAHAHQRKIVHRDIKPTNIIFDESGQPMISDFGLTKILEEDDLQPITSVGVGIGTPEYMSPEQGQGQAIDYATDIYALGVVFYEMVTGHKPFEGGSTIEILNRHINEEPLSPDEWVPDLPARVVWAIQKALAKKPSERYENMDEFARVLERFSLDEAVAGQTVPTFDIDRAIEESVTRVDEPEPTKARAEQQPDTDTDEFQETMVPPVAVKTKTEGRKPAKFPWWAGCLIGAFVLICCILSLAAVGAGAYWLPIAREEGSISLFSTPAQKASPTRRPTRTASNKTEAPAPTEAPVATEAAQPTIQPPPSEAPVSEPIQLEIWTTESGNSLIYLQELADTFRSTNPNTTITFTSQPAGDFINILEVAFAAGDPPDLILYSPVQMRTYAQRDFLYPVDDLMDMSQFSPSLVDEVRMDGKTWGIPLFTSGQLVLYYNKNIITSPPQDTDQMIELAKQHGLSYYHNNWFFAIPWLGGFNGSMMQGESTILEMNTNEMVNMLTFVSSLTNEYNLLPAETEYGSVDNDFTNAKTGLCLNGSWSYTYYQTSLGDDLGVARLPAVSSTGKYPAPLVYGVDFFIANEKIDPNKLQSIAAFLQYATNDQNQIMLAQQLTYLPSRPVLYSDPVIQGNPLLAVTAQQMSNSFPEWMRINWDCVFTNASMIELLTQDETPQETAQRWQTNMETCLQSNP